MDPEQRLRTIESLAGVNFQELRKKYQKSPSAEGSYEVSSISHHVPDTVSMSSQDYTAALEAERIKREGPRENASFGKSKICKECQGQGVRSYMYNHMVLSQNCEACDGEGVFLPVEEAVSFN